MELKEFYTSLRLNLWNTQELLGKKEIEKGKFLLKNIKNVVNIMQTETIDKDCKKFCGFLKRNLFSIQERIDSNDFKEALSLLTGIRKEVNKREIEAKK